MGEVGELAEDVEAVLLGRAEARLQLVTGRAVLGDLARGHQGQEQTQAQATPGPPTVEHAGFH